MAQQALIWENGYYVGTNITTNSGIIEAYYNGSNSIGYATINSLVRSSNYTSNAIKDRLKAWNSETGFYWLASPSASHAGRIMAMKGQNSCIEYQGYSGTNIAFCPLVCIKSGFSLDVEKN